MISYLESLGAPCCTLHRDVTGTYADQLCIHYFYLEMDLFAQFNANHENLQHESSVRRSKLQLQSQQQNVKTSNTPVTVIDVKTRNMPPEIIEYALKISR